MTRVAGVDPGTVSFDICGLDDGEVVFERSFPTADVGADPALLVDALVEGGPFELVLGPAGYGLPLVPVEQVGERELALMLLVREDEPEGRVGVGGMRSIIRALIAARLPLVFGPGAIHLPTIPGYRKWNRIDLGTADKVASVALGIADQAQRLGVDFAETSFVLLELGGAFSAALAVDGGRIVDGCGGSSGPIGARACGAMDAEVAYLIGAALSKRTVFSGGALDSPRRTARLGEGAAKAALALTVSVPAPREILLTGRLAPRMVEALARGLRTWRRCGWPRASRPPRTARRCWPTAWPADATRRSSIAWACATRAAPRSTTSGSTAPIRSGCADQASSHSRIVV